jgi:hypothetical protein
MKTSKFIIILVIVIIAVPLIGHVIWLLQKPTEMDLFVVNKSVSRKSENEFKSLNWVLNRQKIKKSSKELYDYSKDYFGYYPDAPYEDIMIRSFSLEDLGKIKDEYDGVYYLDNKGVHTKSLSSTNFYGGFNHNDYLLLKQMLEDNKLVIAEYNFFTPETEDLVKFNTEQLIDIYSLSWKGKFFKNLQRDKVQKVLGPTFISDWEETNGEWKYNGGGLILVETVKNRVLVLPRDEYMDHSYPSIETEDPARTAFKLPEQIAYSGWFDICYQGENDIISSFNLNLNERGEELLKQNGLNASFPAVIKHQHNNFYYLAGDFSGHNVFLGSSRMLGVNDLFHTLCRSFNNNPGFFFQSYYVPLISGIFEQNSDSSREKS